MKKNEIIAYIYVRDLCIPSMEYKNSKLKITPGNAEAYRMKALECGVTPDEALMKLDFIQKLLEDRYSTQIDAKYRENNNIYRIGDCMVSEKGYSWFFGYGYVFSDVELTPVWYGVRRK